MAAHLSIWLFKLVRRERRTSFGVALAGEGHSTTPDPCYHPRTFWTRESNILELLRDSHRHSKGCFQED